MSKVSEAKAKQGWQKKPDTCSVCAYFTSDRVEVKWYGTTHFEEKNLRCGLGGFKTGKTNTCGLFEARPAEAT